MVNAADDIANAHANANALTQDWARAQVARTMGRAAMGGGDVVYRRTWPSKEMVDAPGELGDDPMLACDGWLDSTLALRDGLSVVEVFAAAGAPEESFERALSSSR